MLLTEILAFHKTVFNSAVYTFSSLLLVTVVPSAVKKAVTSLNSIVNRLEIGIEYLDRFKARIVKTIHRHSWTS